MLLFAVLSLAWPTARAAIIGAATAVNVTPSSFSVVARSTGWETATLEVYADPAGTTSLSGLVGLEWLPLSAGAPVASDQYAQRQSTAALRQKTKAAGLVHVRVSRCTPGATYYYRLRTIRTNGQEVLWPNATQLARITLPHQNSFVGHAKQLVIGLPGDDLEGRIVTVSHGSAAHRLAAVAGDGVGTNEVFFNLSELIGSTADTNLELLGNQSLEVSVLGGSRVGLASVYTLNFPPGFSVADLASGAWDWFTVAAGSALVRAGQSASVPIQLASLGPLSELSFVLDLPADRITAASLQAIAPDVGSVAFEPISATRHLATVRPRPGQVLQGTQELARLTFTTIAGQPSAFVPLLPLDLNAVKPDQTRVDNHFTHAGRITIVSGDPLLAAEVAPDQTRAITLYGNPGARYQMQYSFAMDNPVPWSNWITVTLTELSQTFGASPTTNRTIFFRAVESP